MPLQRDSSTAPIQVLRAGPATEINVTSASVASAGTFGTNVVRLCATVACRVAIGTSPTAIATSTYLAPNVPEYFAVYPNVDKIAVIRESADGKLSITEVG